MTGTAGRTRAARGQLARFVVVLAVLAGLGFVIGTQCTGGMAAEMSVTHGGAAMVCDSPPATSDTAATTCAVPAPTATENGSSGMDGMLATCLAFLVAVVVAVAALRPGRLRSVSQLRRSVRVPVISAVRPRAPSLAELCLLRT